MYDALLVALGVVVSLGVLGIVYYVSQTPRRPGGKRRLASSSGERDDPTKHWPGGDPGSLP
jgi:hypothetical protein